MPHIRSRTFPGAWSQVVYQVDESPRYASDKLGLFQPLFDRADEFETKPRPVNKEDDRAIGEALEAMGVK